MTRHRCLLRDTSGLAMIELAFAMPILVLLSLAGAELTNYITIKMRVSQIALQIADNAARMGSGTPTQAKQVTETDINDVFTGAQMESGALDLKTNGRVILTDVETESPGASTYKIGWRRCYGTKTTYARQYPAGSGTTGLAGVGPTGRQVTATDATPTMFVEVYYVYKPIWKTAWAPTTDIVEIASMSVRERRDVTGGTNGIYNTANAPVASC